MKKREFHAQIVSEPLLIHGQLVGELAVIEYKPGSPKFGNCQHFSGCNQIATSETLIGIQFCDRHFMDFYTES